MVEIGGLFDLARLCIDCLCMQRVWPARRLDLAHHKIASKRRCHIFFYHYRHHHLVELTAFFTIFSHSKSTTFWTTSN